MVSCCTCIPRKSVHPFFFFFSYHNSLDQASAGVLHKADGHDHNVGATPQSSGENSVALSLIETSRRPISTDGCHMYANKEQSESRSPISTTCLPHTTTPKSPFSIHTHTHYLPSKSLCRDKSVLSNLQLYINRSKDISITLIIILCFFFSLAEKYHRQIRGQGSLRMR